MVSASLASSCEQRSNSLAKDAKIVSSALKWLSVYHYLAWIDMSLSDSASVFSSVVNNLSKRAI